MGDAQLVHGNRGAPYTKRLLDHLNEKIHKQRIAEATYREAVEEDLATQRRVSNRLSAAREDLRDVKGRLSTALEERNSLQSKASRLKNTARSLSRRKSSLKRRLSRLADSIHRSSESARQAFAAHVAPPSSY